MIRACEADSKVKPEPGTVESENQEMESDQNDVIVIADDNSRNLYAVSQVIAKPGREIVSLESGVAVLKYLERHEVSLLILDVQMPGLDGFETAQHIRLREKFHDLPIIFLSAEFKSNEFIAQGFESGGYDYLTKPVDALLLNNKVDIFLRLYNQHNNLIRYSKEIGEQSARIHAITDLSTDGYIFIDEKKVIRYINEFASTLLGCRPEEMIGKTQDTIDLILKEKCLNTQNYITIEDSTDETTILLELIDSGKKYVNRKKRSLGLSNTDRDGCVIYFNDITITKEIDELKSEFLSTAAHELRTPLTSIFGFSELLMNADYPTEEQKNLISIINKHAGNLTRMLNDLLDLSRIESRAGLDLIVEENSINKLIRFSIDSISIEAMTEKPTSMEFLSEDLLFFASFDFEKMNQVMANILTNSIKYSKDTIRVEISLIQDDTDHKGQIGIQIQDFGIGMTEKQLARVFERFYRADPSGSLPGTGLGMTLVKQIVELHGGSIQIHSALDKGTKVIVWLYRL